MIIWKASQIHMISGAILCLGSLTCPDKLLISGGAFAAGAGPLPAVSDPALAGAAQILGPRARKPLAAIQQALTVTDLELRPAIPAIHERAAGQSDTVREMPSTMSILRSSATTTTLTDTEDTTNRPILVQGAAANAARCQAAEAEPGSDLEYAISDFFHAVRATAHFAVSIFVGPRSRALTATK